ncbi:cytochrome P450 [Actinomadura pelletieri DSM 43383]|uniref:Cytochrome P450 n=1 Tax=Actinomadura pelletieri DSM 43383 TaxID=1120940 RepID=A0A495QT07_9ACTN|nr:cytochrome P450 [Actinomadura pelletieri]RKS76578.1 cytochrome P450 [Actinomadura pelletieri DSM 43383]
MPLGRGALPLSDAGVLDHADAYAHGVPHDRLDRLRARTPVVWLDGRAAGRSGAWGVLRHDDVLYALAHPEIFVPADDGTLHGTANEDDSGDTPLDGVRSEWPAPIDMDPPARTMLARMPSGVTVDFVGEVVRDLPETLRNTLTGGLYALLRHPTQYARLQEERSDERLIDSAVEEMLRWWTPVLRVWRIARRDTAIGGVPLLAGERVVLWLVSANHDGEAFPDPGRFQPDRFLMGGRSPEPGGVAPGARAHLCFGFGVRACMGARLARVHLRALLDALLERPGLPQLAGAPVTLRSSTRHGFEHLPVRWTTQPAGRHGPLRPGA